MFHEHTPPTGVVDLMEAYSKRPDQLFVLVSAAEQVRATTITEPITGHSVRSDQAPRVWRLADRLSATDINNLVTSYLNGTTAQELARQFGISKTSVKRLLRERGAHATARLHRINAAESLNARSSGAHRLR